MNSQELKITLVNGSIIQIIGSDSYDTSLASLEGIIARNKFHKTIVLLPRQLFMMRYLSVPSEDRKEIKEMLKFQLAKVVPFSLDEAGYDFSILETKDGVSRLLVFIFQEKSAGAVWNILGHGAKVPVAFAVNSQGLYLWAKEVNPQVTDFPAAIIEIDKDCVNFCVGSKDQLLFARSFSYIKSEDIQEGIKQSLRLYEKELPDGAVKKVIFTGIKHDTVMTQFSGTFQSAISENGYSFAALAGISLKGRSEWADFPLPRLIDQRRVLKRKRNIFDFTIIACEVIIILGIVFGRLAVERFNYLNRLDLELKQLKLASPNIESMVSRMKALDSQAAAKPLFSEVLGNLFSALPENAKVSLIDVQNDGEISLKGYVAESGQAFKLAAALNNTGIFKDVSVKYASKNGDSASSGIEFNITGKIR